MAVEFRLVGGNENPEYKVVRTSGSQAYTIGDAVMLDRTSDATDVVPATASSITSNIYGIVMETIASTVTSMLICLLTPRQFWTADATNATNTNHNNQRMVLTDKATVNNTGTDSTTSSGVFQQTGTVSSTRIVGRFLMAGPLT